MRSKLKLMLTGLALLAGSAFGQSALVSPVGEMVPYAVGIEAVDNSGGGAAVVYAETVHIPEAAWLRLYFEDVSMPAGSRVRVTSLLDGEVQELDAEGLAMWGNSTAYFNGDTVSIEVIAGAGTVGTGLRVKQVAMQRAVTTVGDPGQCGICGPDDRGLRNDLWMGRILPTGGTGVVYCPTGTTMITAGSAISQRTGLVIQFNVPASNGNCTIVHPPVLDQFPIDAVSVNYRDAAPGDNWGVFRTGSNGIGQSPVLRYGQYRPLADAQEPPNTSATLSGYGLNTTCTSNQVQQVSQGQVLAVNANYVSVSCDARGGTAGGPVLNSDGKIVGVTTHCGSCFNQAQRVDSSAFAAAIPDCPVATVGNDICANATVVGVGTTTGSTAQAVAGELACAGSGGRDVWYRFTAPCPGTYRFATCGTAWDTVLSLWNGCPSTNPGTSFCNDDSCGAQSAIVMTLPAGATMYVRVAGANAAAFGNFTLTIEELAVSVPNDTCATALPIGNFGVTGSTRCANAEIAGVCGMGTAPDVWYSFVAGFDGNYQFDLCTGTNFDSVLAVYSACGGTVLGCNDNACGTGSAVTVPLGMDDRVLIRVGGNGSARGNFTLRVTPSLVQAQPNDLCSQATPISDGSFAGFFVSTGREGSSTCDTGAIARDVWYAFTPTCNGRFYAETDADPIDTVVSVHTGCPGTAANQITCNDNFDAQGNAKAVWYQQAGTTMYIRVMARGTPGGRYVLHVFDERSNDSCAQPAPIGLGTTPFNNWGAAPDGPDSPVCNFFGDPTLASDLWYQMVVHQSGMLTVDTCGSGFDTKLAVYRVTGCPGAVQPVACNDDACGEQSVVRLPVNVGELLTIRVGGRGGRQGCGVINAAIGPACPWIADGCPADHNNDGSIDGDDVISFFSDWDNGALCADANTDNSVDGDDVITFFSTWDTGGTGGSGCP